MRGFGQKDAEPRRRAKTDFANCQMVSASNPIIPITRTAKCYGIIVEPMLLLCVHDLKPSLERVPDSRPNAAKAVTCVTGGVEDGHARPMTAQVDGERGPIWFFTAKDTEIVQRLKEGNRAIATFSSKGHDLFATVHGSLQLDNDRRNIDRLWNRFVAAWFEGGKDDPKLALLRLDAERAEIWLDGSSLVAGIKLLLGVDPKKSYKGQVAKVTLR